MKGQMACGGIPVILVFLMIIPTLILLDCLDVNTSLDIIFNYQYLALGLSVLLLWHVAKNNGTENLLGK